MKRITKSMFALMGTAILLMAFQCGDEVNSEDINPYNAHHSECQNHTDATAKGFYNPDSVDVRYTNGAIHITHHNLMVNCGTAEMEGGINVTCIRNGSIIDIYESEDENNPQADCMCDVDNEFDIHGLERGTYTFVFHSWWTSEAQSFTYTF